MVDCIGKEYELKCQVAPVVGQGLPIAGHAECLAWRTSAEHVSVHDPRLILQRGEVAMYGHLRVVVRKHGPRERFDLGERQWLPSKGLEGHACGFDAGANGQVFHFSMVRIRR